MTQLSSKKTYKFSYDLLKYLNINDKFYTFKEIDNILIQKSKNLDSNQHCNINSNPKIFHKRILILLDNDGEKLFGKNKYNYYNLETIRSIIYHKYTILNVKPSCDFFEYDQKPIDVSVL
jgi:hypothetical protein